jgi:hypothetical protein
MSPDHNGTVEGRWRTDWSNLQARRHEGQGEQHDRIEYLRERKELERQQDISTAVAARQLAGGGD